MCKERHEAMGTQLICSELMSGCRRVYWYMAFRYHSVLMVCVETVAKIDNLNYKGNLELKPKFKNVSENWRLVKSIVDKRMM